MVKVIAMSKSTILDTSYLPSVYHVMTWYTCCFVTSTRKLYLGHMYARHHTYLCSAEITSPAPPQRLGQQTLTPTKATDIRACLQCRWCRWRLTGRTAQRLLGTGRQRPPKLSLCLHLRIMSWGNNTQVSATAWQLSEWKRQATMAFCC